MRAGVRLSGPRAGRSMGRGNEGTDCDSPRAGTESLRSHGESEGGCRWRQRLFRRRTRRAVSSTPPSGRGQPGCETGRPGAARAWPAFAMTTFVLSMFNANLVNEKGVAGGARPGAGLRRHRAAARGHVGVPHGQHLRRRRLLLVRRLLDLLLGAQRLLRQGHRRQRRPRASASTCGRGRSSPPT